MHPLYTINVWPQTGNGLIIDERNRNFIICTYIIVLLYISSILSQDPLHIPNFPPLSRFFISRPPPKKFLRKSPQGPEKQATPRFLFFYLFIYKLPVIISHKMIWNYILAQLPQNYYTACKYTYVSIFSIETLHRKIFTVSYPVVSFKNSFPTIQYPHSVLFHLQALVWCSRARLFD